MTLSESLKENFSQMLVPPGHGVFTVHTAKENKDRLSALMYPGQTEGIEKAFLKSLENWDENLPFVLGVSSDCGGGIQRGANWGPLFIREAFYRQQKIQVNELGDIRVIPHLLHDKYLNEATLKSCRHALYGQSESPLPVSPLSITEHVLELFYREFPDAKVFGLGGDHSVSYPLVKAFLKAQQGRKKIGLLHFDAHTDLLDQRLGIDLCFGSWTYHILPLLESGQQVVQVGIRSTGKERNHWQKTFGLTQIWPEEIEKTTLQKIADKIVQQFKRQDVDGLYLSFDIDALDASYVSATGTPEDGGLAPHQAHALIEMVSEQIPILGADLVEVAPFVQMGAAKTTNPEPESTLSVASDLSLLLLEKMGGRSLGQ